MGERGKNAVLAHASESAARAFASRLNALGYSVVGCARTGIEAMEAVRDLLPDLLIMDEVLPVLDGLTAAERLLAQPFIVRPGVIVTRLLCRSSRRDERLLSCGCAFLDKPFTDAQLSEAVNIVSLPARRIPEEILLRLDRLLDRLGLPSRPGRAYLKASILYAWQDMRLSKRLTLELYPMVARRFGVDGKKVERDMRRTIEYAWKYGAIEDQYAIFGGTIDAQRGKPTCGEMIAQLADILRLEG